MDTTGILCTVDTVEISLTVDTILGVYTDATSISWSVSRHPEIWTQLGVFQDILKYEHNLECFKIS